MLILRPRLRKGKCLAHDHTANKWDQDSNPCTCLAGNRPDGVRETFSSLLIESLGKRTTISPSQALCQMCHTHSQFGTTIILIFWMGKPKLRGVMGPAQSHMAGRLLGVG